MDAQTVLQRLKEREMLPEISDETALSLIEAARVMLLGYCNIPLCAKMPEGLAEAWCSLAAKLSADGYSQGVTSISEGDVTVKFAGCEDALDGCKAMADRYRRFSI